MDQQALCRRRWHVLGVGGCPDVELPLPAGVKRAGHAEPRPPRQSRQPHGRAALAGPSGTGPPTPPPKP